MGLRSISPAGLMFESFRVERRTIASDGQGGTIQSDWSELGRIRGRFIEASSSREVFSNQDKQVRGGSLWCVDSLGIRAGDSLIERSGVRWIVNGSSGNANLRELLVSEAR